MSDVSEAAKNYWTSMHNQSGRVLRNGHEHRWDLAHYIIDTYHPSSVLEFGCGSGRNLAVMQELDPDLSLTGIDGNRVSLDSGRAHHPSIGFIYGDEQTIDGAMPASYDVVFTVSVLDHIPTPEWQTVYDNLKWLARKAVVMLEPVVWSTSDRRTMLERDIATPDIGATPYTWAHDYLGYDPSIAAVRHMPIGLGGPWDKFGQLYELMECRLS